MEVTRFTRRAGILACVIALLLCGLSAQADTVLSTPAPTPTPTPTPSPEGPDTSLARVSVRAYANGAWKNLHIENLNFHSGGMNADGMAFFMPLDALVKALEEQGALPELALSDDFQYEVSCMNAEASVSSSLSFFSEDGGGFIQVEGVDSWRDLKPGRYLMRVTCTATRGEDYYSGMGLAWLNVPAR